MRDGAGNVAGLLGDSERRVRRDAPWAGCDADEGLATHLAGAGSLASGAEPTTSSAWVADPVRQASP